MDKLGQRQRQTAQTDQTRHQSITPWQTLGIHSLHNQALSHKTDCFSKKQLEQSQPQLCSLLTIGPPGTFLSYESWSQDNHVTPANMHNAAMNETHIPQSEYSL